MMSTAPDSWPLIAMIGNLVVLAIIAIKSHESRPVGGAASALDHRDHVLVCCGRRHVRAGASGQDRGVVLVLIVALF
jgi:hypothetical protein